MTCIYYADALSGAGKTHQALRMIVDMTRRRSTKFIYCGPSHLLLNEVERTLHQILHQQSGGQRVRVNRFDSTTCPGRVRLDMIEHFKHTTNGPEIVLCTHAGLIRTAGSHIHNIEQWHCIVDEIPPIIGCDRLRVPLHHGILTQHVQTNRLEQDDRFIAVHAHPDRIENLRLNRERDEVVRLFQGTADKLANPLYRCHVRTTAYKRLLAAEAVGMDADRAEAAGLGQFEMYWTILPELATGFASFCLMGANLQQSMLWMIWHDRLGVEFQPHPRLGQSPYTFRFTQHDGNRLTIRTTSAGSYSKKWRDTSDNWARTIDKIEEWIGERRDFLFVLNNDLPDTALSGGTRLPHNAHGLNTYDRYNWIVFLSAQNPTPGMSAYFARWSIRPEQVKTAYNCETAYQSLMRTSLRQTDCTDPVTIIVADGELTDWLANRFPGSTVIHEQVVPLYERTSGRPRLYESTAEKHRAHYQRQMVKK